MYRHGPRSAGGRLEGRMKPRRWWMTPEVRQWRYMLPAIWDLVVNDMLDRDKEGRRRYGTPLQPFNGRKPLVDAYQEVLDLAVYMRQEIEERNETAKKLEKVRRHVVAAIHLYGQSHGRDLMNTLWDIAHEIESDEFCERLGEEPGKVFKELYGDES